MLDVFVSDDHLPQDPLWLARRPPWREDLLRACLEEFTSPGDLLLDPFARHAALLRLAQSTDRRVLVTSYDPLPLLQLRLTLSPPEARTLDGVVSRLADTPKDGRPLSRVLDDLYLVTCSHCAHPLPAEIIIWEGGEPVEKGFRCPQCGEETVAPITPADLDIQAAVEAQGASYWRLHQRLAHPEDTDRLKNRVTRLLDLYTARSRYALTELILQAEVLFLGDRSALNIIRGLCLACLQRCHSLNRPLEAASLPRSLQRPRRFVERNVWRTFEAAYRKLRGLPSASALTWASDLPTFLQPPSDVSGGQVLALHRPTRGLSVALRGHLPLRFICADPPRPDPTAYALAFMWSGWLFGRQATLPLRSLALRHGPDWEWYTEAMTGVLRLLHGLLADGGHLLLAFTCEERELLPALLLAAARTELDLEQSIQQHQEDTSTGVRMTHRLLFRRRHRPVHPLPRPLEEEQSSLPAVALELQEGGVAMARAALEVRGEAAVPYWLYPAICSQWSHGGLLRDLPAPPAPLRPLAWLRQQMDAVLPAEGAAPAGLLRLQSPAKPEGADGLRGTCWWLTDPSPAASPLSERLEAATVRLLQGTLAWPQAALHDELCRQFAGLLTPAQPLLEACITSYGQELSPGYWQLRPEDWPEARAQARRQAVLLLAEMGRWMDLQVWLAPAEREQLRGPGAPASQQVGPHSDDGREWDPCTVIWHDGAAPLYGFALNDTAALSPWLAPPPPALADLPRYVIVPGGRSVLLAFKMRCCPAYRDILAAHGWTIVKQRHLRRLADMEDLDRAGWHARIGIDPVMERVEEQLALF
jgi:hypothetical protein